MDILKIGDKVIVTSDIGSVEKGTKLTISDISTYGRCYFEEGVYYLNVSNLKKAPTPRVHAELIKQWADDDSLEIEFFDYVEKIWCLISAPHWYVDIDYRIKEANTTEKDLILKEIQEAKYKLKSAEKRLGDL